MEVIRILLVDDHPVVREGLAAMLEAQPDLEVVGEAENGRVALEMAGRLDPDVILMDLQMPEMDGATAIRRLQEAGSRAEVIVLTTYDTDEFIFAAIEAGAKGYLLKGASRNDLFKAVRAASRGESLLEPVVASKLVSRYTQMHGKKETGEDDLSEREMEVLRLMARGRRNKEIAKELFITEKTAKAHVSNILSKLGVSDRTEAVTTALRRKIINLEE